MPAKHAEDDADDEHGGYLTVTKGRNGRAFHHHHGAPQDIAEDKGTWQQKSDRVDHTDERWRRPDLRWKGSNQ